MLGLGLNIPYLKSRFSAISRPFLKQFSLGEDGMAFSSRNLSKPETNIVRGLLSGTSIEGDSETFLGSVVPANVQALYNNAMWFGGEGSGDYVDLTDPVPDSDTDFSIALDIYHDTQVQGNLLDTMKNSLQTLCTLIIYPGGNLGIFIRNDTGSTFFKTLPGILTEGVFQRLKVEHVSSTKTLSFYVDGVFDNSITYTGTVTDLTPWRIGSRNAGSLNEIQGVVKNITIETSGVVTSQIAGDGNTDANWVDTVGSNDGTVTGSPALFTGQSFSGTSPVWYNQAVDPAILALYGKRTYFAGDDDFINLNHTFSEISTSNEFNISFKVLFSSIPTTNNDYRVLFSNRSGTSGVFIYLAPAPNSATGNVALRPHVGDSSGFRSFDSAFEPEVGVIYSVRLVGDGSDIKLYIDDVEDANSTTYNGSIKTFITDIKIGDDSAEDNVNGVMWDYVFASDAAGTNVISSYEGYGNTDAAWQDRTGSNDGTVNGSPSLFKGEGLPQLTQTTEADQPDIVSDGSTIKIVDMDSAVFDGTNTYMSIPNELFTNPSTSLLFSTIIRGGTLGRWIASQYDTGGAQRCWAIEQRSDGILAFPFSSDGNFNSGLIANSAVDLTTAKVIGFVYDGTQSTDLTRLKVYINGVQVSTTALSSVPTALFSSSSDIILGGVTVSGTPSNLWVGEISEIIYSLDNTLDIEKLQQNQMKAANII